MKRKARVKTGKSRAAASRLKSKRMPKSKIRQKKVASARKTMEKARKKAPSARAKAKLVVATKSGTKKIVRIMGQGQYIVDTRTLKKLNDIDNTIVQMVSRERSDDMEFKKMLVELNELVVKTGRPLDPKEIIQSDIILPSADLSIDEAKKLFKGEGVIPEI
jgi:hypothetical protein